MTLLAHWLEPQHPLRVELEDLSRQEGLNFQHRQRLRRGQPLIARRATEAELEAERQTWEEERRAQQTSWEEELAAAREQLAQEQQAWQQQRAQKNRFLSCRSSSARFGFPRL